MNPHPLRALAPLAAALTLSACSTFMPPAQVEAQAPAQWHTPLPHQGTVGGLTQWWERQGDPLLVELIAAAQAVSPSISQALARVEASRAQQASARGALLPNLNAQYAASRGVSQPNFPVTNTQQLGLQTQWEIDLVGANRAVSRAAQANVDGTQAQWHDARVSVAAEVANLYYSQSTCLQQLALAERDATSRGETARLTEINAKAGFLAPSLGAMARASAADGNSRLTQQRALCELNTKALVALTAIPEPDLKKKLTSAPVHTTQNAPITVASVPAQTIAQRPDVFSAERDVMVASAQVGAAKAQRLPRLTLAGSIAGTRLTTGGVDTEGTTWSFGPLAVSLPIFDGGQRAAAVTASEANYDAVVSAYRGKVRQAVREVEEALINLASTEARTQDAIVSTKGYAESLAATQSRFGQGLASLVELEDARRNALASESAQLALALERNRAWVALYRALGGGFEPDMASKSAAK
ncbi:efflux transporter outer membrane subunit [Rhodoferax sp. AJA081-3]|nr:efflux transporter outer membrane subunit [Rhodoferax sp. AJA081-3]